eukprot:SAG11_NODE_34003_length_274_cov_0.760000_2_plen_40_part_01
MALLSEERPKPLLHSFIIFKGPILHGIRCKTVLRSKFKTY